MRRGRERHQAVVDGGQRGAQRAQIDGAPQEDAAREGGHRERPPRRGAQAGAARRATLRCAHRLSCVYARPGTAAGAAGRSREAIQSAAGSAVKSAIIASSEGGRGHDPELPQRREARGGEPEEAGGVDERREDDGAPRRRAARGGAAARAGAPARSCRWWKKWIWSFSVVPSTVVAMMMVATLSDTPRSRIPRNVTRIAKSDGIIARTRRARCGREEEDDEDEDQREGEALGQRGHEARAHLLLEERLAHHPELAPRATPGRRRRPRPSAAHAARARAA